MSKTLVAFLPFSLGMVKHIQQETLPSLMEGAHLTHAVRFLSI